jgi:hypothetical protein
VLRGQPARLAQRVPGVPGVPGVQRVATLAPRAGSLQGFHASKQVLKQSTVSVPAPAPPLSPPPLPPPPPPPPGGWQKAV